jgi:hypothetical protein
MYHQFKKNAAHSSGYRQAIQHANLTVPVYPKGAQTIAKKAPVVNTKVFAPITKESTHQMVPTAQTDNNPFDPSDPMIVKYLKKNKVQLMVIGGGLVLLLILMRR